MIEPKPGDLNAMLDDIAASEARLAKQVRIEDGFIIVNVEYAYEIPIADCDTAPKLLGWIIQLLEKTWITSEVLERFIRVASAQSGIEIKH